MRVGILVARARLSARCSSSSHTCICSLINACMLHDHMLSSKPNANDKVSIQAKGAVRANNCVHARVPIARLGNNSVYLVVYTARRSARVSLPGIYVVQIFSTLVHYSVIVVLERAITCPTFGLRTTCMP